MAAAAGHGRGCEHCVQRGRELSLYSVIDATRIRALNESEHGAAARCFCAFEDRFEPGHSVSSDVDEQLIIIVPFTESVKLKSITVMGVGGPSAPRHVRLWRNNDGIDFTNCDAVVPTASIDLSDDVEGELDYPLSQAKFADSASLTIMFDRSYGAEQTRVVYIGLKGESAPFRRAVLPGTIVYELTPQARDHRTRDDALAGSRTGF